MHIVHIVAPDSEYVPGLHSAVGVCSPSVAQNDPIEQGVQDADVAPPAEYVPLEQFPVGCVRPVVEQYWPTGHFEQGMCPVADNSPT